MSSNSKIEWTHHTANLWHGCTKVHEGCDHCYAETLSHRWGRDIWGNDKPRMEIKSVWDDLKKQQAMAAAAGEIHRVFVGSMMDIFERPMPLIDSKGDPSIVNTVRIDTGDLRNALFQAIDLGKYPNLLFLFLTKRPSNINKYIPESWKTNPPANVMFGTSPVNQETANKLISQLLQVNGKRFLSIEPMLGPVDLTKLLLIKSDNKVKPDVTFNALKGWNGGADGPERTKIHWVICGGESGHGARPMHPDWARSLRDQCNAAGVPFLFKQWGEWIPFEETAQQPFWRRCDNHEEYDAHGMNMIDAETSEAGKWNGHQWYDTMDSIMMSVDNESPQVNFLRVGKKAAGRLLDGQLHDELPIILKK